ncbi:nucleoside monophosphate kinase [Flavobacterium sp. Fl-77]|jgi:adenylate kinase|uniref:Adenylate kinase n=1 Tax=Flavobacterium flavipigmentatum TaxID=2893884 RepID=A0AAJ2SEQ9_9FLAO|nr:MULTISPECIES: nucleoside monophosphate kinase [unclassified Flavobacterium]MDX6181835.1 nucleoside monophosphate kinase [Flavobacterium sp. Fl-33]MDX6185131.1 nucleoside monophosphate kinase [Flavobacterium sp. Fl-77]UFH37239.1 nucleoside monophosphate kinase [Flavobacterium sp. F-70]
MEILIITGPPYSGKGTQCEILKNYLHFEHISTGDRCRLEKQNETEIGKIMSEYEEKGDLVPDSIMKDLFSQILNENKSNIGVILDGYPRTQPQVNDLIELVNSKQMKIGKVLNIEVPKSELLARAKKRAETSNRKDDKDAKIHIKRIEVFEESTRPAIEYMKSKIKVETFDGLGSIDEITKRIKASL